MLVDDMRGRPTDAEVPETTALLVRVDERTADALRVPELLDGDGTRPDPPAPLASCGSCSACMGCRGAIRTPDATCRHT